MTDDASRVDRTLFIEAEPETVFEFLVDPARMPEWFGISHVLDARPGGKFRVEASPGRREWKLSSNRATPADVYELIMDSRKHQSLSGERARISRKVGGRFTAWGSHISGINLVLKPGEKIVQAWRATGWWPDHYSIAIFDLEKVEKGTRLRFTQIGGPPNRYSGHYRGWIETYWTPMKEILAEGAISERTQARVKADRTQRIDRGLFRRRLTKET